MQGEESAPLWTPTPDRAARSAMARFARQAEAHAGRPLPDFPELHAWSVEDRAGFWSLVWDFCGMRGEKGGRIVEDGEVMPGARFFPDARLNFAENLVEAAGDGEAIVFRTETGGTRRMSRTELREAVSRCQKALARLGVGEGDRVAAIMPNMPETVVAMLAAASLGAIWSSCSPDFGERGILDRFGQIEPKVLIACDGYYYGGKTLSLAERLAAVVPQLPSLSHTLVVSFTGEAGKTAQRLGAASVFGAALAAEEGGTVAYRPLPFAHPLYILYSSGTTGAPKCIVHSAGGTLIQHLKEHVLHCDTRPGDRVFYFTTCGWMMWNWLVSALGAGAVLLLYDGSPFHPDGNVLFDFAEAEGMSVFGTSAKYIDAVRKAGLRPRDTHDLGALRLMTSTGSPLGAEGFDHVYAAVKPDIHLASISGGTDIVSCFVLGNPLQPVRRGEIQGPGLGMAVDIYDEEGRPVRRGKGELVCTAPFPVMPVMFWRDPDGAKYRAAYFERFEGVWCHGDFAEWTAHGGLVIHGRSDATLNPGGVRIGTAEIYAQVERLPEIVEAIAIGQDWEGDVRIVLFVRLAEGVELDEALRRRIRTAIREGASPRHVPARIVAIGDIPRTKSGKITELAVRDMVHGREVKNREALANPEALDLYRDIAELRA